jgi:hypothetical protein
MKIKHIRKIGAHRDVVQIVPPRHFYRPAHVRSSDPEAHELVSRPLTSPTGPGAAKGFRNVAGSQISAPVVTNIYLGPFWGDRKFVDAFSKDIVERGYLMPLQELGYGTGPGRFAGSIDGPPVTIGAVVTQEHIEDLLTGMLNRGELEADENALYFFIFPDKVTCTMGQHKSCAWFCGYHDAIKYKKKHIAYAVMPSALCKGCGGEIGDFTAVYAHELAEAVTDKVPGKGWVADDGSENGDLEAWILFPWGPPDDPKRYIVQGYYTNERGNTVGPWKRGK